MGAYLPPFLADDAYVRLGKLMAVLGEEVADAPRGAILGKAAKMHGREVAGEADGRDPAAMGKSDKGAGDGAAEVVRLGFVPGQLLLSLN